jgi:hypothetical protein
MVTAADAPASPLTIRLAFNDASQKFTTSRSAQEVRSAVEEMLESLRLDVSGGGEIYGQVQHAYSSFMTSTVKGELFKDKKRNELVLDLTVSNNVTALAIVLCILCWPLLIVGACVLPNSIRDEIGRKMRDAFRQMERELTR